MAEKKGLSLHIGLNAVDPDHYNDWSGELESCENDANAMESIASGCGFQTKLLLTRDATKQNTLDTITHYASELTAGDIFLFTFSGHGGRVFNFPNRNPEFELFDETLCLFDEMLVDDELKSICWPLFQKDVRIQCVFDSCHSGGMLKYRGGFVTEELSPWNTPKYAPNDVVCETLEKNKERYQKISQKIVKKSKEKQEIRAIVAILAACTERQVAYANHDHSLFTDFLLKVWKSKEYSNLEEFCTRITNSIPNHRQTPNLQFTGSASEDLFRKQMPFEI